MLNGVGSVLPEKPHSLNRFNLIRTHVTEENAAEQGLEEQGKDV